MQKRMKKNQMGRILEVIFRQISQSNFERNWLFIDVYGRNAVRKTIP
jgi:hypothetical protein